MSKEERAMIRVREASKKLSARETETRRALQQSGSCSHPKEYWFEHTRQSDDGYGHWYTFNCRSCQLCLAFDDYADGRWRIPEGHLR